MTLRLLVLTMLLEAAAPAIPNVVILLANNVRTDDLSCYNPDTPAPTPNIDRLAAGGVLLRHHTVPALTPTANRAAHLTGQMPTRYGLQESEQGVRQILHTLSRAGLPNSTLTYADLLKKSGYRTKAAGGWELGWACESWADACHSPLKHGFDSFHGVPLSVSISEPEQLEESLLPTMQELNAYLEVMANQSAVRSIYRPIAEAAWYQWLAQVVTSGGSLREQARLTAELQQKLDLLLVRDDAVARWPYSLQGMTLPILFESLEFIKSSKRAGKPFLLQHSFLHVHDPPVTAPHRVGNSGVNAYYDSVLELDWAVGRVLDHLEELELLDDTIVYFASDFNDLMSYPPKTSNITDARVPGMFMYRGLMKPHVLHRPTSVLDLLPTVVDVIGKGAELLSMELDGRSLFFPYADAGGEQPTLPLQLQRRRPG
ncbi:arylsulfatase L-like isoform X2 [Pollicipes pollicipes]|uniref:arylsulfatase L-like isoform X1 n=1 Tax=Pollicipes pollicipes TaxID=41117 RepID=UPI0018856BCB|nr:arylsulfatase L-like isoform X1 [Pollicipes pollicipes]XP_037086918.1 arylsulfatase L-like isoform X2 [Pollicipes pollicipes]